MFLVRWSCWALVMCMMVACQGRVPPPSDASITPDDSITLTGLWTLEYVGKCAGREPETIEITVLDDSHMVFDEFTLTANDEGHYVGSIQSIAPMPADGRDIVFETTIDLVREDRNTFAGTETITESGKSSDDCPIRLVYQGEE